MIAINRPAQYYLDLYGPEQFEVTDNLLALHFLKTRNGDNKLCFFEAQFEHMTIKEIPPPAQKKMMRRSYSTRT